MEETIHLKKAFLLSMIIFLSLSALIGIFIVLFGNFGQTEAKILLTTLTIGGYSLTGLCCSILYERKRFKPLALTGIVISIIGFLFTVLVIWEALNTEHESIWKTLVILIILAASTAHACLIMLIKSERQIVNIPLIITIAAIFLVAVMLIILVITLDDPGEAFFRILGTVAILDALGTIVTPILNKIYS